MKNICKSIFVLSSNRIIVSVALSLLMFVGPTQAADNSHAKLHTFNQPDGSPADGSVIKGSSAKLTRGEDAVWVRVKTTGLPPGAYTNWWIIFNNPDECAGGPGGCNGDDFGNPAVMASVRIATGGVVGSNGIGRFRTTPLEVGDVSGSAVQHLFGPGLLSAKDAEIHYLIRYHGPAGTGDHLIRQTTTVNGGCLEDPVGPTFFPCYDPQGAGPIDN